MISLQKHKQVKNNYLIEMFYVPCLSSEETSSLAQSLLEHQLIACANMIPINSMYRWHDQIQSDTECVMVAKTLPHLIEEVQMHIEKIHSYDIPCIVHFTAHTNKVNYEWITKQVKENKEDKEDK
jgi:periplasmic divalent cation tolerance protein